MPLDGLFEGDRKDPEEISLFEVCVSVFDLYEGVRPLWQVELENEH